MGFTEQITFIYTEDLEATSHFYGNLLSFPLVLDQGVCRIYKTMNDAYIGFCKRAQKPTCGDMILTFVTEDVDFYYNRLLEAGIPIEKPPQNNPDYNIYHFFARDPNGYLIEIQRFNDPDWNKP